MEYDTGFNQVRATLKFDPCAGGHFDIMQIKHISASGIFEDFKYVILGISKKWILEKNLYLQLVSTLASNNTNFLGLSLNYSLWQL